MLVYIGPSEAEKDPFLLSSKEGCLTCHVTIFISIYFKHNLYEHLKE